MEKISLSFSGRRFHGIIIITKSLQGKELLELNNFIVLMFHLIECLDCCVFNWVIALLSVALYCILFVLVCT